VSVLLRVEQVCACVQLLADLSVMSQQCAIRLLQLLVPLRLPAMIPSTTLHSHTVHTNTHMHAQHNTADNQEAHTGGLCMPGFTTIELHTLGRVHCIMVRGDKAAAQQWVDCLQLLTKTAAAVTGAAVTASDSPTAARRSGTESVVSSTVVSKVWLQQHLKVVVAIVVLVMLWYLQGWRSRCAHSSVCAVQHCVVRCHSENGTPD
jgi:hypothetical protein